MSSTRVAALGRRTSEVLSDLPSRGELSPENTGVGDRGAFTATSTERTLAAVKARAEGG